MKTPSTATLTQLIELLTPLTEDDRLRTIRAALTFLGYPPADLSDATAVAAAVSAVSVGALPRRAESWLTQNGLRADKLDRVFLLANGDCQVIAAALPGTGPKDQAKQCYLLAGVAALLATGDPRIDDGAARDLCRQFGCYDSTNHTKYVRALGNAVAERAGGWQLTRPGLDAAAELVKQLVAAAG